MLLLSCKPGTVGSASSPSGGDAAHAGGPNGPAADPTPTPTPPGYHELGGKLDKQDITMKLTRTGDQITGTYQYVRIGKDIPVKGTVSKTGAVEMQEFGVAGDKPSGWFTGTWQEGDDWPVINFYGDWAKTKGAKDTLWFSVGEQVINSSLKIETVMINEEVKKPKYTIDVGVPRIVGSSNPNAEKFNQLVKSELTRMAADFKNEATDNSDIPPDMPGSSFDAGYTVLYADKDLISVQFDISPYSAGAAHPGHAIQVYNYNLKDGRLWKLSDLFAPGAKYLDTISKYCTDNLLARLKPEGQDGGMGSDPDWVKNGAAAKAENYENWNLSKKGLLISFAPYEVASYADGPQYVTIPYSQLKSMANPSGPLAGF
jgi:hypothetical protein